MEIIDSSFRDEPESIINRHNIEDGSNTPDFILADYLRDCLRAFNAATKERSRWYEHEPRENAVLTGEASPNPLSK
jgi:hypothetical protein